MRTRNFRICQEPHTVPGFRSKIHGLRPPTSNHTTLPKNDKEGITSYLFYGLHNINNRFNLVHQYTNCQVGENDWTPWMREFPMYCLTYRWTNFPWQLRSPWLVIGWPVTAEQFGWNNGSWIGGTRSLTSMKFSVCQDSPKFLLGYVICIALSPHQYHGVSNHRRLELFNSFFRVTTNTASKFLWLFCCFLILQRPLDFLYKGPVIRISFPCNDVIMKHPDAWYDRTWQWRHNGCDSVSNHQPHYRLPKHLFKRRSKKT